MTQLLVHSTLHRGLVELVPAVPGEVGIYVCGATVQSEPHVGHGRYAVVFDMIRRYLVWRGQKVTFVRNITDIDDKIITAAAAAGETVPDRARRIAGDFATAYRALGVAEPDFEPKATEHVPEMVSLIQRLVAQGLAYRVPNGDVYFAVRALESYGKLSGRKPDEMRAGARVEISESKHDPLDFALWKSAKPGEPSWDSPWGPGRPGWHIECSAMAARYLGSDFTIHGGGTDLIFPHHENEIAQSEGATGTTFARYWLHNGLLNLAGEKMSKSTGVLVNLQAAITQYGGMSLRLFYLQAHYRSPLDYSEELVEASAAALDRMRRFFSRAPISDDVLPDPSLMERFTAVMDEDFSTPEALALFFDAIGEANRTLDEGVVPAGVIAAVRQIADVLGFVVEVEGDLENLAGEITALGGEFGVIPASAKETLEALLAVRVGAREVGDFTKADRIRDRLAGLGILIEDTVDGTRWLRR
ncbi:MAG: cysteine--tRNA ligase [Actinomycetota bacterium]